jgi:thiosulfate dehydrogenase
MHSRNRSGHLALALAAVATTAAAATPVDADTIAANGLPPAVPACQTCHGAKGEGNILAGFPRLAGAGRDYVAEQLAAFASGQRQSPVMQSIAAGLSTGQQAALARYYAEMAPSHRAAAAVDPSPSQAGAWLAARGRWTADIPACAQCHGAHGLGVGDAFPPLAGQPAGYLAAQLQAWRHGTRPPGPQSLMAAIASRLSDDDVTAVADYYASLPADGTPPTAASGATR